MTSQRSIVVSVIAWIFIVFSGVGFLNALLFLMVPASHLMPQLQWSGGGNPPIEPLMRRVMLVSALVDAWVLLSAIGLLRRRAWARISVIAIAATGAFLSAVYALLGGVGAIALHRFPGVVPATPVLPMPVDRLLMLAAVCGLLFLAVNLWALLRLLPESARKEFESIAVSPDRDR